jgi:P27 family predicted phage terminase small subunit
MPRDKTPPPQDLDGDSKALWKKTRKQLEEQNTWHDSDAATLERYIRALERARQARASLPRDKKTGVLQLTTKGSKGQLVQHPNVKTIREAERDAHEYAKDLLLTPKSREQHEIEKKRGEKNGKFGF